MNSRRRRRGGRLVRSLSLILSTALGVDGLLWGLGGRRWWRLDGGGVVGSSRSSGKGEGAQLLNRGLMRWGVVMVGIGVLAVLVLVLVLVVEVGVGIVTTPTARLPNLPGSRSFGVCN